MAKKSVDEIGRFRAGSYKDKVYSRFVQVGEEAARKYGLSVGLKASTLNQWVRVWNRELGNGGPPPPKKPKTPKSGGATEEGVAAAAAAAKPPRKRTPKKKDATAPFIADNSIIEEGTHEFEPVVAPNGRAHIGNDAYVPNSS